MRYIKSTGIAGAVGFLGLILGTPLAFLAYPLVVGFTVVTYIGYDIVGLVLPEWLLVGGVVSMLFGNAMMIIVSGVATLRRHGWRIAIFALAQPVLLGAALGGCLAGGLADAHQPAQVGEDAARAGG